MTMMFPVAAVLASSSHYERNPGRLLAILLGTTGFVTVASYISPHKTIVYTRSGYYEIMPSKPKSLKSRKEQVDICEKYIKLFEMTEGSCDDCRPQLKNLCGIDPDEVLTNLRRW